MRLRKYRKGGIRAWLVTWEHTSEHVELPIRIAAILNPRVSSRRVREIVELLYVNTCYSLGERVAYANNKRFNRHPAEFDTVRGGVGYLGRIICGENSFLFARWVNNLACPTEGTDQTQVNWEERRGELRSDNEKIRAIIGEGII